MIDPSYRLTLLPWFLSLIASRPHCPIASPSHQMTSSWIRSLLFPQSTSNVTLGLFMPGHTRFPLIRFLVFFPVFVFLFTETDDSGRPVVDSPVGLSPQPDSLDNAKKVSHTAVDSLESVFTDASVFSDGAFDSTRIF